MKRLLIFSVSMLAFGQLIAQEKYRANEELETSIRFNKYLEYDSAYIYAKKALAISKLQKNDSLAFASALELYKITDKLQNKDTTDYFSLAAKISQKSKNLLFDIELYYTKGNMHYFKDEHADALPLYLKIDSISKANAIYNSTVINAIIKRSEISRQKFTKENSENAEKLLLEALRLAQDIKSEDMVNYIYTYLADVSGLNGRDDDAKRYIDMAFDYYIKKDDVRNLSQLYLLKTAYYLGIDDLKNAIQAQSDRLNYLRTKDDKIELARALVYHGSFNRRKTKDYAQAIKSLEEAKIIYDNINNPSIVKTDNYERLLYSLAICYNEVGKHKIAFDYFDKAYDLREDVIKKTNRDLTSTLEARYEAVKKEKEISELLAQKIIVEEKQKNQTYLFLSLLSLGIIAVAFLFYAYRNKLKTSQKLKELDGLKSKFFANISHEFRTPLTLIKSPLQLLKENEVDISKQKHLSLIEQHSDRMLSLVDQLLQLSKIDSGNLKLLLQKSNISTFLEALIEPYQLKAQELNFKFIKHIDKTDKDVLFDKDVIEKIVSNLLSNALKYTPNGKTIEFHAQIGDDNLQLTVANPTETIKTKDVSKLFERFYQDTNATEGVGIGLALVKELVTLYKGKLSATINDNILLLKIDLPLDKELLKEVSIISEPAASQFFEETFDENDKELPMLLVVDDNADIRSVLKDLFKKTYHVIEASDGKEALKIALKEIPDLIISDVMMPKMDGFELTKKLKENELTSFVPIILLTAKASDELHLKGLHYNVDDYITKPFNHDILRTKVFHLLEIRQKLRERYSKELILKPTDIRLTSVDEKFIERLEVILEKQISNAEFSIDDFAKAIGMSRMQLHRKLKSLLGVSATEFLRSERLKAAANLLKKGNHNVSDVAYSVGFNDVSYFSKCFKDMYQLTPSEYISKS